MGNKELKKTLQSMHNLQKELSGSKEKSLKFLIEAGIVTEEGELTPPYQQSVSA